MVGEPLKRLNRNTRAMSPTISTVILTGTIVALLSVTIVFINTRLWSSVAESDFSSAKQYMQTIGLEMDDVAWTVGRKETVRYSSSYGSVSPLSDALNYTFYVYKNGSYQYFSSYKVGILQFNIPDSKYSITDGYYEQIFPKGTSALTFSGVSAPVARVFAVEKLTPPMADGSFTRVVVSPAVRFLSSDVNTSSSKVYYLKLYLPILVKGSAQGSAQSVTMTGSSLETRTTNQVSSVRVTVSFPWQGLGFDNSFFHFQSLSQIINVPGGYSDAILELYAGTVETVLGVQS
jgi:hypothetical protein